jgi:APA family basic amino acid/polyamine antiporter
MSKPRFSAQTALALVVANMIGVGVFTSLSFQALALPSVGSILWLWLVGGLTALCGALCYAEVATSLGRSGGEYAMLDAALHPLIGFLAGFISLIVGFAAPVAAAAMALSAYSQKAFGISHHLAHAGASAVVIALCLLHAHRLDAGALFQRWATWFKIALVAGLAFACLLFAPNPQPLTLMLNQQDVEAIFSSSAFAVSLVYVAFAYSGWNAAVYALAETKAPARSIPRALIVGTLVVTLLYLLLNAGFLRVLSLPELRQIDAFGLGDGGLLNQELTVGFLAGKALFGEGGATIVALLVALGLLSAISAMSLAGPRVSMSMGEHVPALAWLKPGQGPARSSYLQLVLVLLFFWSQSFTTVIATIGICLSLSAMAVVVSMFVLRARSAARPFSCPWHPVPALLFLGLESWMVIHVALANLRAAWISALVLVAGSLLWFVVDRRQLITRH